jgi:hypothetical protein
VEVEFEFETETFSSASSYPFFYWSFDHVEEFLSASTTAFREDQASSFQTKKQALGDDVGWKSCGKGDHDGTFAWPPLQALDNSTLARLDDLRRQGLITHVILKIGGPGRDRTGDIQLAKLALSQLSYEP